MLFEDMFSMRKFSARGLASKLMMLLIADVASMSFDEPKNVFGYMPVYQQKASGYQYDLNHTIRWFFYFSPDSRKNKATHEPASNEE